MGHTQNRFWLNFFQKEKNLPEMLRWGAPILWDAVRGHHCGKHLLERKVKGKSVKTVMIQIEVRVCSVVQITNTVSWLIGFFYPITPYSLFLSLTPFIFLLFLLCRSIVTPYTYSLSLSLSLIEAKGNTKHQSPFTIYDPLFFNFHLICPLCVYIGHTTIHEWSIYKLASHHVIT